MTRKDKITLFHFISRTGMYIFPVDPNNIQSFMTGYDVGRLNKCHFLGILRTELTYKYKIAYPAKGWPGQIQQLADKRSLSFAITFRQVSLEILFKENTAGTNSELSKLLRTRIGITIDRITGMRYLWQAETLKEEWLSFALLKSAWFRKLWTAKQWLIIKALNKEIVGGNITKNKKSTLPSNAILTLRKKFDSVK